MVLEWRARKRSFALIQIPTLTAVGISYWTASLPIAAEVSERLQASSGPDTGAGSVTSIDGDDILPGEPLIGEIQVLPFIPGRNWGRKEDNAAG